MPQKLSDIAERVNWVLQRVYRGSQTRMAEAIGVSQSAISNVVTGRQEPGRRFLAAVSTNELINSLWLMTGRGDPLANSDGKAGPRAAYLVVSLFEGLPADHGDCLGSMLEVPLPLYRPSRYWVKITSQSPLTLINAIKVSIGDFVLFEPDREGWPNKLINHPCIVRAANDTLRVGVIKKVDRQSVWLHDSTSSADHFPGDHRTDRRVIMLDPDYSTKSTVPLSISDVIAIGVFRMGDFANSNEGI